MATIYNDWDTSWTVDGTLGATIATGATDTGDAITLDGKSSVQVAVECAYGGTATQGLKVFILGDYDGTNYQVAASVPSVEVAYATSSTRTLIIPVSGFEMSKFKVHLTNDSGATVTTEVRYRYNTITTA
jgi:hypothetical protein